MPYVPIFLGLRGFGDGEMNERAEVLRLVCVFETLSVLKTVSVGVSTDETDVADS